MTVSPSNAPAAPVLTRRDSDFKIFRSGSSVDEPFTLRGMPDARRRGAENHCAVKDVDLDLLAIHWREALDAAEDSLGAVGRSRPTLPPAELRDRLNGLKDERGRAELDLEQLARATHAHLHRHLRGPRAAAPLLGLGAEVRACVFDLDGVLTASADLHAAAWQEAFDELLAR